MTEGVPEQITIDNTASKATISVGFDGITYGGLLEGAVKAHNLDAVPKVIVDGGAIIDSMNISENLINTNTKAYYLGSSNGSNNCADMKVKDLELANVISVQGTPLFGPGAVARAFHATDKRTKVPQLGGGNTSADRTPQTDCRIAEPNILKQETPGSIEGNIMDSSVTTLVCRGGSPPITEEYVYIDCEKIPAAWSNGDFLFIGNGELVRIRSGGEGAVDEGLNYTDNRVGLWRVSGFLSGYDENDVNYPDSIPLKKIDIRNTDGLWIQGTQTRQDHSGGADIVHIGGLSAGDDPVTYYTCDGTELYIKDSGILSNGTANGKTVLVGREIMKYTGEDTEVIGSETFNKLTGVQRCFGQNVRKTYKQYQEFQVPYAHTPGAPVVQFHDNAEADTFSGTCYSLSTSSAEANSSIDQYGIVEKKVNGSGLATLDDMDKYAEQVLLNMCFQRYKLVVKSSDPVSDLEDLCPGGTSPVGAIIYPNSDRLGFSGITSPNRFKITEYELTLDRNNSYTLTLTAQNLEPLEDTGFDNIPNAQLDSGTDLGHAFGGGEIGGGGGNMLAQTTANNMGVGGNKSFIPNTGTRGIFQLGQHLKFTPISVIDDTSYEYNTSLEAEEGVVIYDSDTNRLRYFDGNGWRDTGLWHLSSGDLTLVNNLTTLTIDLEGHAITEHFRVRDDLNNTLLEVNGRGTTVISKLSIGTLNSPAFTFPETDGSNGQVLVTDGSGTISWTNSTSLSTHWTDLGDILKPATDGDGIRILNSGGTSSLTLDYDATVTIGSSSEGASNILNSVAAFSISTTNDAIAFLPAGTIGFDITASSQFGIALGTGAGFRIIDEGSTSSANELFTVDDSGNTYAEGTLGTTSYVHGEQIYVTGSSTGTETNGYIYYDTDTNEFQFRENGSWVGLSGTSGWTDIGNYLEPNTNGDGIQLNDATDAKHMYLRYESGDTAHKISANDAILITPTTGSLTLQTTGTYQLINKLGDASDGFFKVTDSLDNSKFAVRSSGVVTINNVFSFPTADGSSDDVLKTNGTGTLSWSRDENKCVIQLGENIIDSDGWLESVGNGMPDDGMGIPVLQDGSIQKMVVEFYARDDAGSFTSGDVAFILYVNGVSQRTLTTISLTQNTAYSSSTTFNEGVNAGDYLSIYVDFQSGLVADIEEICLVLEYEID